VFDEERRHCVSEYSAIKDREIQSQMTTRAVDYRVTVLKHETFLFHSVYGHQDTD